MRKLEFRKKWAERVTGERLLTQLSFVLTVTAKLNARSAETAMFYIAGKTLSTALSHLFAYVGNLVSIIS